MSNTPVALFAFANDRSGSLSLHDEGKQCKAAMKPLIDAERIRFEHIHGTRFKELFTEFNNYHGRIRVFHFGGHSHPDGLALNGSDIAGTKLANLLGEENELKLVFLNGCHNDPQVKQMLDKGIPVIIATSVAIGDIVAKEFATEFYHGLAAGRTIRSAFTVASTLVNDKEKQIDIQFRRIAFESDPKPEKFEWGLYYRDEEALEWTVPAAEKKEGSSNVHNYGNIKNQINNPKIQGDLNIN